jgi:osmotically-inducible protein OsmY
MNRTRSLLIGMLAGAGVMFLLDPKKGRRRRALVRDKAVKLAHTTTDTVEGRSEDVRNRARGVMAEAQGRLRERRMGEEVPDIVLEERVRSAIGRATSHPGAVVVHAHDGRVTLAGPVLRDEAGQLLSTAKSVRGVRGIEDRLQLHDEPGRISSLQS